MAPAISPYHRRAGGNGRALRRAAATEAYMSRLNPIMTWRHRITALVVELGTFFRLYEKGLLTAYGAQTDSVTNGQAATDLIYNGRSFDLIVIDASLRGPTGIQTTRQLRTMGVCSVILGLTTTHTEEEREAFLEAGADDLIERPLTPEKLIPILAEIDNHQ